MKQSGFTLLEMLISMVLLAIMMGLILGALRMAASSWDQGEKNLGQAEKLLLMQNFFQSHLNAAIPLNEKSELGVKLSFRGNSEGLEYVGVLPAEVKGGLYRFGLYWQDDELRLWVKALASDEIIDDLSLLEKVEYFKISYLKRTESLQIWQDEWHEAWMPALIRLQIALSDEAPWPELIIAPKVEVLR